MRAEMPEFYDDALCAETDLDLHYPERGGLGSANAARKVCRSCDVIDQCLEYALENREPWGIWGGRTERERAKILRARDAERKAS